MPAKEGELMKCKICGKELTEDRYWTINEFVKEISYFPCPKCGKPILIEEIPEMDSYEIKKPCTCTIKITKEAFEDSMPKWKQKVYPFCDECFKKAYGQIMYIDLGED